MPQQKNDVRKYMTHTVRHTPLVLGSKRIQFVQNYVEPKRASYPSKPSGV